MAEDERAGLLLGDSLVLGLTLLGLRNSRPLTSALEYEVGMRGAARIGTFLALCKAERGDCETATVGVEGVSKASE